MICFVILLYILNVYYVMHYMGDDRIYKIWTFFQDVLQDSLVLVVVRDACARMRVCVTL